MKNFQQNGERLVLFPAQDVQAGEVVVMRELVGVAVSNYAVADGDGVVCDLVGVYMLPKAAGAWEQGQPLFYDTAAKMATTTTGPIPIGHAADVATIDAAEGSVRLKG